jgi:predicted DNA-binding transcriptional regulator YafY
MDRTERFYKIDRLLRSRRTLPLARFLEELEVSRATFKRDLEYLRDRFGAPIVWDRDVGGYRYATPEEGATQTFALPGFWLSAQEVEALLTLEQLLENLHPGFLADTLTPLRKRLEKATAELSISQDELRSRVRILKHFARPVSPPQFAVVAQALLERRQLHARYYGRGRNEVSDRVLSPQRLVHYRDNWYLDAWCHDRKALRSFALDSIQTALMTTDKCRDVPAEELDRHLASGYGIFSGEQTNTARLRFAPEAARWVSKEIWHPKQRGEFDGDGHYLLEVPYSHDRELLMDILRHGAGVEVVGPASLRSAVKKALVNAAAVYM